MPRVLALLTILFHLVSGGSSLAQAIESKARQAFLMDAASGTILFQKGADEPFPPASLAKLMTVEIALNAISSGQRKLTDSFTVSENAWRHGGAPSGTSTMFAALGSRVGFTDLLRGIMIQAANDGCIAFAEGISGTEAAFSNIMNRRAKALGLTKSVFANATGLPQPGQQVTVRDIALLSRHLVNSYPDFYRIYSEPDFTWGKITQRNRNPLLGAYEGADGLGLGFAKDVGFSIAVSAKRGNLRLIAVLAGMANEKERVEETRKLLDWGFEAFLPIQLFAPGEIVAQASVFGGESMKVPLVAEGPVVLLVDTANQGRVRARVRYTGPLIAPVVAFQPVGSLQLMIDGQIVQESPVFAAKEVKRGKLWQRALSSLTEIATGWYRSM